MATFEAIYIPTLLACLVVGSSWLRRQLLLPSRRRKSQGFIQVDSSNKLATVAECFMSENDDYFFCTLLSAALLLLGSVPGSPQDFSCSNILQKNCHYRMCFLRGSFLPLKGRQNLTFFPLLVELSV